MGIVLLVFHLVATAMVAGCFIKANSINSNFAKKYRAGVYLAHGWCTMMVTLGVGIAAQGVPAEKEAFFSVALQAVTVITMVVVAVVLWGGFIVMPNRDQGG